MKKLIASALLLILAACTSTTIGGANGSPNASGTGVANTPATPNTCGLLVKADVEAVVGSVSDTPIGTSVPSVPGVADKGSACVYHGATGLLTVAVLDRATSRSDFDNIAKQVPGAQAIPSLGDAAYGASGGASGVGGATVLVLKGTAYLSLSATSSSKTSDALFDGVKGLARAAIGKL
jgi:hypothetical protein